MRLFRFTLLLALVALVAAGTACDDDRQGEPASAMSGEGFSVVASVPVLADLAQSVVGDDVTVSSLVPPGADPHEFRLSESEIEHAGEADVLLVVGRSFEPAFADLLGAAGSDAHVSVALQYLERPVTTDDGVVDPHFWHDPVETASVVEAIGGVLAEARPARADEYRAAATARARDLRALGREVGAMVEAVPESRRGLVTQHDFLRYFAGRYGFRVRTTIIPGLSSQGEPTASSRLTVKQALEEEGVCVVFDPESNAATLSEVVASEAATDVRVVPLLADTVLDRSTGYDEMARENARRIVESLVGCG